MKSRRQVDKACRHQTRLIQPKTSDKLAWLYINLQGVQETRKSFTKNDKTRNARKKTRKSTNREASDKLAISKSGIMPERKPPRMINQKASWRKKRPTRAQVAANIDIFRPSPTFDAEATGVRLSSASGNLRAFVNVQLALNGTPFLLLRGVRIVRQQGQQAYAQMPCQQSKRDGKYYPIAKSLDTSLASRIKSAALAAYEQALGGAA